MSSPAPRRSIDNSESPRSISSNSQYPFPQYDSPQRPGSSGRYGTRHGSTASSITSIGRVLDPSSQGRKEPIAEFGNNAIATLLQPPIVRTGLLPHTSVPTAQKPPSTKDIPPVALTNIPHIELTAFKPYLTQAGSLYEAFQRAKEDGDDGGTQLFKRSRNSLKADQLSDLLNHSLQRRQSAALGVPHAESVPSESPYEMHQSKRRTSGGPSRRAGLTVTPLSTIPNVYFEQDFHIENPRTFDIVSERSEIVRPSGANGSVTPGSSGRKALASNAILQEKLSWYMDTVEIHLISSISTASSSFFAALGSLRELHSEASDSVAKIKMLRQDLGKLDQDMAIGGLKVVAMRRRRENMRKLGNAVDQLRQIVEAMTHCEEQVYKGKVEEAIQGLAKVERLIAGENEKQTILTRDSQSNLVQGNLIDLRGIKAMESSGKDIALLRRKIGKGFEARFIESLLGDLRRHVDGVPSSTTFQRWDKASQRFRGNHARSPSVFPAYLHLDETLGSTLRVDLQGLAQSECVMPAALAYREAVQREIKSLIRRHLPSSSDDDNQSAMSASTQGGRRLSQQEKSSILAENLRALDAEDAEKVLQNIYSNVGEALRRLGTQVKVLLDITSSLGGRPASAGFKSPEIPQTPTSNSYPNGFSKDSSRSAPTQLEIQQVLDLSSLLGQVVDAAQTQITKVLKVRSEQTAHLTLPRFLRYFSLNRLFADECEAVSGRGGTALKTMVNNHIKDFVAQFGDIERRHMIQSMDADRWDAKDFTEKDAEMLARVLEGSTKDVEFWTKGSLIWEDLDFTANGQLQPNGPVTNGVASTRDKVRSATIDEQKYILPESALTVLGGIEHFEHLMTGIPSMTQEITSSLLEYLKIFNSRSSQLILGAGATRSAGLKNITTKHLALASQALSFVITITPYIREFVRRHSSGSGNPMVEFDKVKRLYQEHQSGIYDKLVDIMSGRATTHIAAMKKIDWDTQIDSQNASPYVETLVKETTTLHKVLSKHLPEITVRMIMDPVFSSYREQWGKALLDVEVQTGAGRQRLLHDVEFFKSRIIKIDGAGDIGDYLTNIIKDKSIAQKEDSPATVPNISKTSLEKPAHDTEANKS